MEEIFEKIIEKLKERCDIKHIGEEYVFPRIVSSATRDIYEKDFETIITIKEAIEIVKQAAEEFATYTNVGSKGWIPVSERLPEEAFGCLVTVMDCEPSTQTDFENILPYFVGYDGHGWNDADGEEIPFEVVAWQPLPLPYTKGE